MKKIIIILLLIVAFAYLPIYKPVQKPLQKGIKTTVTFVQDGISFIQKKI